MVTCSVCIVKKFKNVFQYSDKRTVFKIKIEKNLNIFNFSNGQICIVNDCVINKFTNNYGLCTKKRLLDKFERFF